MRQWYYCVSREIVYEAACRAIEAALLGQEADRARRRAKRCSMLGAPVEYQIIHMARGDHPPGTSVNSSGIPSKAEWVQVGP